MSSLQRGQGGFHVVALGLPLGETLLVFLQNVRRNFLREIRIGQLLFDLGNLGFDFLQFLFQPRLFGLDINQSFQRQKQIAQLGRAPSACFSPAGNSRFTSTASALSNSLSTSTSCGASSRAGLRMNLTFLFAAMFAVRRRLRPCGNQFVARLDVFLVLAGQAVVRFEIVVERLRPRREHDGLAALIFRHVLGVTHPVPEFLRDERQERMKQPQRVRENEINHGERVGFSCLS